MSTEITEAKEYRTKQRRRGKGASRDRNRLFSRVMFGLFERNFNWSVESETWHFSISLSIASFAAVMLSSQSRRCGTERPYARPRNCPAAKNRSADQVRGHRAITASDRRLNR